MKQTLSILFGAILVNNIVLSQFLGICPFLGVSKKLKPAMGMGVTITIVMVVASIATRPISILILKKEYKYLETVVFVLVIAGIVQLMEIVLKRFFKNLYKTLGIYLPLITTNCAILGVVLMNSSSKYSYFDSVVHALGAGLGFLLAMVMFVGVRGRLEDASPSPSFKGTPIMLISASFVSLSFLGFSGVLEGLFK